MFYIARIIIGVKDTSLALLIGICCNNAYARCVTDTNTAIWYGGFGTAANQKNTNFSHAYRATSDGMLLGLEHTYNKTNWFGAALAYSNTNIKNTQGYGIANHIFGDHLILYGTNTLASESYALDWLFTGVLNKNNGTLYTSSNPNPVNSSYRNAQSGLRLNLSQTTDNDNWQFSLIETARYTLVYLPSFREINTTAQSIDGFEKYNSIVTVGGGVRLSFVDRSFYRMEMREIHFMGLYSPWYTNQVTVANFLNSVADFTVVSASSKWSFQAGGTYTFTFFDNWQLQFNYDFEIRTKYNDNSFELKLRYLL